MTGHLIGRWEPNTPDWHQARAGRVGGSDIGSIVGVSPWTSRDELLAEKLASMQPGWEPSPMTDAMLRGHWLEPAVMAYLVHRGHIADPQMAGTWVDDVDDWASYNPDGVSTDGVLLEAKSTRTRHPDKWGRGGTNQIPDNYLCQISWGCGLLGLDRWALGVIATKTDGQGGSDFDIAYYRGRFDADLFKALKAAGRTFINDMHALTEQAAS